MKPGERIRDYVLEERIGAGGVGEVWRARHERLDKPVAIKRILPHLYQDENIYKRSFKKRSPRPISNILIHQRSRFFFRR